MMSAERFQRVADLFEQVRQLPADQRQSSLEAACADDADMIEELLGLLNHHDRATASLNQFPSPVLPRLSDFDRIGGTGDVMDMPERIGRYRVIRKIAEGGMGVVYLAEQDQPRREVAIKVIKPGMDSRAVISRFEQERQALAVMDHPSIAKVLDAGTTERGLPYFVMEYVRGMPITEYCDRRRLDIDERIKLFISVCKAVQHAHMKGVIHRDLKPSNVLVADEDAEARTHDSTSVFPKIIDFGIAKALNRRLAEQTIYTEQGQLFGTPEYMSPEQAEMSSQDTDTRADVYSLGVMLYELLAGALPFDSFGLREQSFYEIQRIIREIDPPRPSTQLRSTLMQAAAPSNASSDVEAIASRRRTDPRTLFRDLSGDLDWIVMKCLEKDRERRYDTANALAQDLRRHRNDEPVLARPPSVLYNMRKFARRNRALVGGTGLAAMFLFLAVVGTSVGLIRTQHAEAEAQQTAAELAQVVEFQHAQLSGIDVPMMGQLMRGDILERVAESLTRQGLDPGEVESRLVVLRNVLDEVNFTDAARKLLDESIFDRTLAAIDEQFSDQPLVRARLLQTLANTMTELGLLAQSEGPQIEALTLRRHHLGDYHEDTLRSISRMATLLRLQGRFAEAERYSMEAMLGFRRVYGDDHPEAFSAIGSFGAVLLDQGKLSEAEPYYREAYERTARVLGRDSPKAMTAANNMGYLLRVQGRLAEAESYYRDVLERRRRIDGDEHPQTLTLINNMGFILQHLGRLEEAEPYFREVLEVRRRQIGDEHARTLTSMNNMGMLLWAQGKFDEAEPLLRQTLDGCRRTLGEDHADTLGSIHNLGLLLRAQGRLLEAEGVAREAVARCRHVLGEDHPDTLGSIQNLGVILYELERFDEAEPLLREGFNGHRRVFGVDHPATLQAMVSLSTVLRALDRIEESFNLAEEAVQHARSVYTPDQWQTAHFLAELGRTLAAMQRYEEAQHHMLEAHTLFTAMLGLEHDRTRSAAGHLAALYNAWHEAEPHNGHDKIAAHWQETQRFSGDR